MTDGTAPNLDWSRFVGAAEQRLREVRAAVASGDIEDAREALAEVRHLAREAENSLSADILELAEAVNEQPAGHVGAIGLLLEQAVCDEPYRQMVARNGLTELLPRLEREQLATLHPHYREMLGRALSRGQVGTTLTF